MNRLNILLEQLRIDPAGFETAELSHVKVSRKTGTYRFYIHAPEPLKAASVAALENACGDFPYACRVIYQFDNFDKDDVLSYAAFVFATFGRELPELTGKTAGHMDYADGVLTLKCVSDLEKTAIDRRRSDMEATFASYGLDVRLNVVVEASEDFTRLQKEMDTTRTVHVDAHAIEEYQRASRANQEGGQNNFGTPRQGSSGSRPFRRFKRDYTRLYLKDIDERVRDVEIEGYIFKVDETTQRSGRMIQTLYVTDYTDSIIIKRFEDGKRTTKEELEKVGKGGKWIHVTGSVNYDNYSRQLAIEPHSLEFVNVKGRQDTFEEKRIELHAHTLMSTLDSVMKIEDYVAQAKAFGHTALGVTDHGNCHIFPDCQSLTQKAGLKMIYGVEMNMVDTDFTSVHNVISRDLLDLTFVSFDLETTGLSQIDDYITEFGAVKYVDGMPAERMQSFIRSPKPISPHISKLTSITNDDIKNAPTIEEFMDTILDFFGDSLLVAHNGVFDIGMLNKELKLMGREPIKNVWVDTLPLARHIIPYMQSYRLGKCCGYYHIPYDTVAAHRADYDAEVLGQLFNAMVEDMRKKGIKDVKDINGIPMEDACKHAFAYPVDLICINHDGLKNMFRIISEANTTYLFRSDRIPRERLEYYRDGLLFGSGPITSKLFEVAATKTIEDLKAEMAFYDYIEIQPLEDAECWVYRHKYESLDEVQRIYERIIQCAKQMGKIIVATGDVHFLEPYDKVYRDVFITNEKITIGGRPHPLLVRGDPNAPTPNCYFRTTDEMMQCFPYLPEDECYEYVVTNTHKVCDMLDDFIEVVKKDLYPPKIDNVDQLLTDRCYKTAHDTYGEELPDIVQARLDRELTSIINNGYAVIYYIASELVRASNDDGYLVGSRGSVGSSFVATMAGISEVNPLAPHYQCPECKHSIFVEEGMVADGFDLPEKVCPKCGHMMKGEGHNIPFETFLGFNADKTPDIDLNFSGEYQPKAHNFTKKIFGEDYVFRAGTIASVAEKTAYGYAKAYSEAMGMEETIRPAELERLAAGCTGVKRTTGQHPGGIIVIPNDMEIFDFTPYQYPADDTTAAWRTTHFDFHKIDNNVLKFDILGHVDPTATRMLQDMTGVDPKDIPTNDPHVLSLFSSYEALGCDLTYLNTHNGAIGLPEFGTPFVRGMLDATQPKSFADLVIISGLSHGTDVYLGNAETLIKTGTCTLSEVIGCRDDIMVYLIEKGVPNRDAFDIMEFTRKGKAPKMFPERGYVELLRKHNVPQWYIDSCLKIKYMFPKAHAVAYVLSALRMAWWKLYYPREYYAVYFSIRCDAYEIDTMIKGKDAVWVRYQDIVKKNNHHEASNKEQALITVFEAALEMFERGYHFSPLSLEYSGSRSFTIDENDPLGIVPCFTTIDGLGDSVADTVVEARNERPFTSLEDVRNRTRLTNTHIDTMTLMGVFDGLQERDQLSIFDLM